MLPLRDVRPTLSRACSTSSVAPVRQKPCLDEIAGIDGRGQCGDWLDLLNISNYQSLFRQREGWSRHLGQHLACLVNDQKIDMIEQIFRAIAARGIVAARHLARQRRKGRNGAWRQHHSAGPHWLDHAAIVAASAVFWIR